MIKKQSLLCLHKIIRNFIIVKKCPIRNYFQWSEQAEIRERVRLGDASRASRANNQRMSIRLDGPRARVCQSAPNNHRRLGDHQDRGQQRISTSTNKRARPSLSACSRQRQGNGK